jgi:hypothetical protein
MTKTPRPRTRAAILAAAFIIALSGQANAQSAPADLSQRPEPSKPFARLRTANFTLPQAASTPPPPKRDSLVDGLLVGAGLGALLGLIPDYYDDCEECHDALYVSTAVGAGVGVLIDLLRNPKAPACRTATDEGVALNLALGRGVVGVRGKIAWK